MTIELIPTFEDAFYNQFTTLEGKDYSLEFRYSQREDCWYFSIGDPEALPGVWLVAGIKVVCETSLIGRYNDPNLPPGMLMAVSSTPDASPPKLDELGEGKRVQLLYYTSDLVKATKRG